MGTTAAFRGRKEVRSFKHIRRSNSGRILNLIGLGRGTKQENPSARLFFTNTLNETILTKHNVRENERDLFAKPVKVATKIFIPFDPGNLDVGGRSFFIEEIHCKDHLRALLHVEWASLDPHVQHDIRVLQALSHSPTLDPFIVTECLRSEGIRIDPTFFADSYAPVRKASEEVFEVFRPLLEKALGKVASAEQMARFVDQVWNVTTASTENPFLEALQIPRSQWASVIFAWKSLIYYDLMSRDTGDKLDKVMQILKGTTPRPRPSSAIAAQIVVRKRELAHHLYRLHDGSTGYIRQTLQRVADAILQETGAMALSKSLQAMAENITSVGMNVVLFEQVTSYFLYLYPKPSKGVLEPEELDNELANLIEIVQLQDSSI